MIHPSSYTNILKSIHINIGLKINWNGLILSRVSGDSNPGSKARNKGILYFS
ncbi:MAG: hypothetical protein ACTHK0_00900 [Ginsengibacter sp.]